jgi:hypothetical protein
MTARTQSVAILSTGWTLESAEEPRDIMNLQRVLTRYEATSSGAKQAHAGIVAQSKDE